MSREDDRRALERFVAGLPVNPEELTTAITAKAVSRAIVVESLLISLDSDEPSVRRRAARRAERTADADPAVEARLRVLVVADEDERVRVACAQALRQHGLPVPGEDSSNETAPSARRRSALARLELKVSRTRSGGAHGISLIGVSREHAGDLLVRVHDEGGGNLRFVLTDLPRQFEGSRLSVHARTEPGQGPLTQIGTASEPVVAGEVTIRVRLESPPAKLTEWLACGVEIAEAD